MIKITIFVLGMIMLTTCVTAMFRQKVKKTIVPKKANNTISAAVWLALVFIIVVFAVPMYAYIDSTLLFNR